MNYEFSFSHVHNIYKYISTHIFHKHHIHYFNDIIVRNLNNLMTQPLTKYYHLSQQTLLT